jgi:hypothetical protein
LDAKGIERKVAAECVLCRYFPREGLPAHVFGMFFVFAFDEVSVEYCINDGVTMRMYDMHVCVYVCSMLTLLLIVFGNRHVFIDLSVRCLIFIKR